MTTSFIWEPDSEWPLNSELSSYEQHKDTTQHFYLQSSNVNFQCNFELLQLLVAVIAPNDLLLCGAGGGGGVVCDFLTTLIVFLLSCLLLNRWQRSRTGVRPALTAPPTFCGTTGPRTCTALALREWWANFQSDPHTQPLTHTHTHSHSHTHWFSQKISCQEAFVFGRRAEALSFAARPLWGPRSQHE